MGWGWGKAKIWGAKELVQQKRSTCVLVLRRWLQWKTMLLGLLPKRRPRPRPRDTAVHPLRHHRQPPHQPKSLPLPPK